MVFFLFKRWRMEFFYQAVILKKPGKENLWRWPAQTIIRSMWKKPFMGIMKKDALAVTRALILRTGQDTWSHICSHGHILGHIEEVKKTFFRCNSKQTCTIPVSNGQFGDPCSGVRKYFEATFTCNGKEHSHRWYLSDIDHRAFGQCPNFLDTFLMADSPPQKIKQILSEFIFVKKSVHKSRQIDRQVNVNLKAVR